MGVSLQQWRVAVGSFTAKSSSKSPKSRTMKVRVRCSPKKHVSRGQMLAKSLAVNIILMVLVVETLVTVSTFNCSNSGPSVMASQFSTSFHPVGEVVDNWTAGQVRRLLLLVAMDVEANPGPNSSENVCLEDKMVEGLAELMSQGQGFPK